MRKIIARKVKDGWIVEQIETRELKTKDEVLKFIYQSSLKLNKSLSTPEKIYAE